MKKIGDFEIIDHGIQHLSFPNCTSASFEYVVTGFGDNPAEAIDNCLNQIAMSDFGIKSMEARILEQMGWDAFPISPFVDEQDGEDGECHDYYHISIRWNETHKLPIRIGGLMCCCIHTIDTTTGKEGDIINCQSCNAMMQVKNYHWEKV